MKRVLLLSGPVGLTIVRLSYWAGLLLLILCAVTEWSIHLDMPEPTDVDYAKAGIYAGGIFILGFVLLRCLAEVIITIMEVRDKLGAIERNTLMR